MRFVKSANEIRETFKDCYVGGNDTCAECYLNELIKKGFIRVGANLKKIIKCKNNKPKSK